MSEQKHTLDPSAWNFNLDEAPKDGTEVWLQNDQMEHAVLGKWGKFLFHLTGNYHEHWGLTRDPLEKWMPMRPGSMVVPTKWQPVASTVEARP